MEQAVEQGGGQGAVVVEDLRPLLEGAVGGNDGGAALVALTDHLEQGVGAELVDRQIAQLVDHEQRGLEQPRQLPLDARRWPGRRPGY